MAEYEAYWLMGAPRFLFQSFQNNKWEDSLIIKMLRKQFKKPHQLIQQYEYLKIHVVQIAI